MKFRIEGIRKGKALENFLELPPVLRNRLYYLRYFGGAMVPTIRHRWSKLSRSNTYANVNNFVNSGGMWRGLTSRIQGRNAVVDFVKTSLPSKQVWLLREELTAAQNKALDQNLDFINKMRARRGEAPLVPQKPETPKQVEKRLRKSGSIKKISNRLKAKTSQRSTSFSILEPSRDEVNALTTWMEEHLERNVVQNLRNVSQLNKKAIPDRFNQILKRLPNPKNKR